MGAGDGSGPERYREADEAGRQDLGERELRHEHAAHEQRVRHRDVVDGSVTR